MGDFVIHGGFQVTTLTANAFTHTDMEANSGGFNGWEVRLHSPTAFQPFTLVYKVL